MARIRQVKSTQKSRTTSAKSSTTKAAKTAQPSAPQKISLAAVRAAAKQSVQLTSGVVFDLSTVRTRPSGETNIEYSARRVGPRFDNLEKPVMVYWMDQYPKSGFDLNDAIEDLDNGYGRMRAGFQLTSENRIVPKGERRSIDEGWS